MPAISDHHQYLFLGKITNSLSTEEERELQELFARDSQAQQAYSELVKQLPLEQVAQSFDHLNTQGFWKDLSGEIRDQQVLLRQRKVYRAIGVCIVIGIIAVSSWWLMTPPKPLHQAIAKTAAGSVELRLADGSKVDLSAAKGNMQKGQLVLDNNNNTLRYRAVDGSPVGVNTVNVPVAMDYRVNLSDGSEIWLNSMSSLQFPSKFASSKREITITGEAYCKIAKRANQPFIIHLPGNTVEVTGTEFNVNTYSSNTVKVALVTGAVNIVSGQNILKVAPGFQAVAENGLITQAPFQAEKVLSWRQGLYVFEAAGLNEISAVLARWYGVKTELDDPSLADKKFTGALYKHKPLHSFLDNITVISHIDSYIDEKKVLHFTAAK